MMMEKKTTGIALSLCLALMLMAAPSTAQLTDDPVKDPVEKEIPNKEKAGANDDTGAMSPSNDDFVDAQSVMSLPYSDARSTSGATTETGEPTSYAPGTCASWEVPGGATAWYDYTASSDASVSVDTFGSDFDTFLAVHTGNSVDSLSLVACNDDSGSLQSNVIFDAVAGTTYRIQVGGYEGDSGNLDFDMTETTPLSNDDFADSISIGALPYTNSQSTEGATTETDEPSPCAGIAGTVWYDFTPADDTMIGVDTFGSGYDTALAVYTGSSVDSLTLIECNDDSGSLQSQVSFSATSGTTYRIQVGGFVGNTGALTLNVNEFAPATNDDRADAIAIEELPYSNTQSTFGMGEEPGEPSPCGGIASTVWYSYTPGALGFVTVDTFGSGYDTVLAAYIEVNGLLVNLACNDDSGSLQSQIQFLGLPGVTVYIQVGGYFGDSGALELNAS